MTQKFLNNTKLIRKACIFDWAGTVVDAGVFAPVLTFQKLFEDEGVPITSEEVRAPMGVHKRVGDSCYYNERSHCLLLASHTTNLCPARCCQ